MRQPSMDSFAVPDSGERRRVRISALMAAVILVGVLFSSHLHAQSTLADAFNRKHDEIDLFQFIRIKHQSKGIPVFWAMRFFRSGQAPWAHDFPTAEYNIYDMLRYKTTIEVTGDPRILELDTDELFNYPVIYICEIGYWELGMDRAKRLGEYLRRGGFMIVDDFRLGHELEKFRRQMRKAVPEFSEKVLDASHPIFNCFFEFQTLPTKDTPYYDYGDAVFFGWFDKDGRLVAIVNYNNDIGDGWELQFDTPTFTPNSFMLGINYFVYSMTH